MRWFKVNYLRLRDAHWLLLVEDADGDDAADLAAVAARGGVAHHHRVDAQRVDVGDELEVLYFEDVREKCPRTRPSAGGFTCSAMLKSLPNDISTKYPSCLIWTCQPMLGPPECS
jgi:hypothetical protein